MILSIILYTLMNTIPLSSAQIDEAGAPVCTECFASTVLSTSATKSIADACESISATCEFVPQKQRMQCPAPSITDTVLNSGIQCLTGVFRSAVDFAKFVFDVGKFLLTSLWQGAKSVASASISTAQRGAEYMQQTDAQAMGIDQLKGYIMREYEIAKRRVGGAMALPQIIGKISGQLMKTIVKELVGFFDKVLGDAAGCYRVEAKVEMVCKTVTDFIMPPAALLAVFKGLGLNVLKQFPKVAHAVEELKLAKPPTETAKVVAAVPPLPKKVEAPAITENEYHQVGRLIGYTNPAEISRFVEDARKSGINIGRLETAASEMRLEMNELKASLYLDDAEPIVHLDSSVHLGEEIVGDISGFLPARAATKAENARYRPHFNEHSLSASQIKDRIMALAKERIGHIQRMLQSVSLDSSEVSKLVNSLQRDYGDLVALEHRLGKAHPEVRTNKMDEIIQSCLGDAPACPRKIKYSMCNQLAGRVSRSQLGLCNKEGPAKVLAVEKIKLAESEIKKIGDELKLQVQEEISGKYNEIQLRKVREVLESRGANLSHEFGAKIGIRGEKETSFWGRSQLNGFLKEHWGDGAVLKLESLQSAVKSFASEIYRDPKLVGGQSRLVQIKYGEYRVNVRFCEVEPCPNGAKARQILSVYPECGPDVFVLVSLAKMMQSTEYVTDYKKSVVHRPCK